jgi:hypothetical protein
MGFAEHVNSPPVTLATIGVSEHVAVVWFFLCESFVELAVGF